jgi:hypothetical protein
MKKKFKLKQGGVLFALLFKFTPNYVIRKVQEQRLGLNADTFLSRSIFQQKQVVMCNVRELKSVANQHNCEVA